METYKTNVSWLFEEIINVFRGAKIDFDLFKIFGLIMLSPAIIMIGIAIILLLILSFPVTVIGELLGKY